MDATAFWKVIGEYNSQTITVQIKWSAKLVLGVANLYIGIVFFGVFGTEPIQFFFALPLYLCCGGLLLFECIKNKDDVLEKPKRWQSILLLLFVLYPAISFLLGNTFPQMVTYIMPCPIVSVSIAVYSGYRRKNRFLLLLLTIWGLTGIKSLIFSAYEDIILLVAGIYGVCLIFNDYKGRSANR